MRHFHVKNTAGIETGSWSAGRNGTHNKVLAQLTDTKGSQSRTVLDVEAATMLVHHLITACQAVINPNEHPKRQPGFRWEIARMEKDVQIAIYDDVMPGGGPITVVEMTIDDVMDFADKLMEAISQVQRANNEAYKNRG